MSDDPSTSEKLASELIHRAHGAERRVSELERTVVWTRATAVGEMASSVFEARGVAVALAHAISAHLQSVTEPRSEDRFLWDAFQNVWTRPAADWDLLEPAAVAAKPSWIRPFDV